MTAPYAQHWRDAVERPQGWYGHSRLFVRNRVLDLVSRLQPAPTGNFLRCLFCHYVFDDQIAAFESLIRTLQTLGQFVDSTTAVQMLRGERPVEGRYFHLSFDDGLKNNFVNAVPVLAKLGVPCVFFVPPAYTGATYEQAARYCLQITRYRAVMEMASWQDLREAVAAGFEIGSHSLNHARLSEVAGNAETLRAETAGSKQRIEDALGVACRWLAWPYGTLADINEAGFAAIRAAGYEAAFGNFRAPVVVGKTDPFRIPRHHFEPQWPLAHVRYFGLGGHERIG